MKPRKMKAYASFSAWKQDQSPQNRKLISALSRLVEDVAPGLTPSVKWGQGCWMSDGSPKMFIHAEPDHLQFGFYAGSRLNDVDGLLVGKGKHVRHVKVFTAEDIRPEAFEKLIRQIL
jgi:hypothetical protein